MLNPFKTGRSDRGTLERKAIHESIEGAEIQPERIRREDVLQKKILKLIEEHRWFGLEDIARRRPNLFKEEKIRVALADAIKASLRRGQINDAAIMVFVDSAGLTFDTTWLPDIDQGLARALRSGEEGDILRLRKLREGIDAKIPFPEFVKQAAQERYAVLLRGKDAAISHIRSLAEELGIAPDYRGVLHADVIQCQRDYLSDSLLDAFDALSLDSGIEPDYQGELLPSVLLAAKAYLHDKHLGNLIELIERTHMKEAILRHLTPHAQELYRSFLTDVDSYLDTRYFSDFAIDVHHWTECLGVAPDWKGELHDAVMAAYKKILTAYDGHLLEESLEGLQYMTGLDPDFQGELRGIYGESIARLLSNGWFEEAEDSKKKYGMHLDLENKDRHVLRSAYAQAVNARNWDRIADLQHRMPLQAQDLREPPLAEALETAYVGALQRLHFETLDGLKCFLDWKPNPQDPHIQQMVQRAYKTILRDIRPEKRVENITVIAQKTKVQPDWQGELRSHVLELLVDWVGSRLYWSASSTALVSRFYESTGVKPTKEEMEEMTDRLLSAEMLAQESAEYLQHVTANIAVYLEPVDWQKRAVSVYKAYQILLSHPSAPHESDTWDQIRDLRQLTNIEPGSDIRFRHLIQRAFGACLRKEGIRAVKLFANSVGMQPDWQGELRRTVIDQCFNLLKSGAIGTLKELITETGVEPDWHGVHKKNVAAAYEHLLRNGKPISKDILAAAQYEEPNFRNRPLVDAAQEYYRFHISHLPWAFFGASTQVLTSMTNETEYMDVKPDFSGRLRETVVKAYRKCLSTKNLPALFELAKASGIKPDFQGALYADLQQIYRESIESGHINSITQLHKQTGVAPDWEGILKTQVILMQDKCVSTRDWPSLDILTGITGVKPDFKGALAPTVRELAQGQLAEDPNHWGQIRDEIQERTGVTFDRAWMKPYALQGAQSLIHNLLYWPTLKGVQDFIRFCDETGVRLDEPSLWHFISNFSKVLELEKLCGSRWNEVRAGVAEAIRRQERALYSIGKYQTIKEAMALFGFKPQAANLRFALALELTRGTLPEAMLDLFRATRTRFELTQEDLGSLRLDNPRSVALIVQIGLPKNKAAKTRMLEIIRSRGTWQSVVPELLELRGPAVREEFCPWAQQLAPLLRRQIFTTGTMEENAQGLVEFVRRFGMINVPRLAACVIDLIRTKNAMLAGKTTSQALDQLTFVPKTDLKVFWKTHGINRHVEDIRSPKDIDIILQELEDVAEQIKLAILRDEPPPAGCSSPLDMDILNTVVPCGQDYGATSDRATLSETWNRRMETARLSPAGDRAFRVPDGYLPHVYPIRLLEKETTLAEIWAKAEESVGSDSETSEEDLKKKRLASLRERLVALDANKPLVEFLQPLERSLADPGSFEPLADRLSQELTNTQARLAAVSQEQEPKKFAHLKKTIRTLEEQRRKIALLQQEDGPRRIILHEIERLSSEREKHHKELAAALAQEPKEGKRKSLKKAHDEWLAAATEDQETLRRLLRQDAFDAQQWFEAMRIAFGKDLLTVAAEPAYAGMMRLVEEEALPHVQAIIVANTPAAKRSAWGRLFQDEILQHFAHPTHRHEAVRPVPFTKETRHALESLWRIRNIREQLAHGLNAVEPDPQHPIPHHPLADVLREIETVTKEIAVLERSGEGGPRTERKEIMFYPVRGLGRIFSGDIGNACFSNLREQLANNTYPNLNALLMVDENDKETRLLGSTLLIEAKTLSGKRVLIIRALNPIESVVLRELDPRSIVEATTEYAIATAEARGLDEVRICFEHERGRHASNVSAVIAATIPFEKERGWQQGEELVQTPETQFNRHDITHPFATRVVWKKVHDKTILDKRIT